MHKTLIRFFDLLFSVLGILILLPVFFIIAVAIVFDSRGGVFYRQARVGKGNKDFTLFKFRTMKTGSDLKGLLSVGQKDSRVTGVGSFLRKYKLDELPQLFNVLVGTMSLVGPRPEVRKYVALYTPAQMQVLNLRPGITDYASIAYANENELLAKAAEPERTYVEEIMPAKLELNRRFIEKPTLGSYFIIILKTVAAIF
jgi:lipopolysaccharide/colanic/teichoic acid biosynthesis glycosyltransferase